MALRLAAPRIAVLALMFALVATLLPAQWSVANEEQVENVRTIDWERFDSSEAAYHPNASKVSAALGNATRYAVTTWWNSRYADQTSRYLNFGGVGEANIRPAASEAYALAVALKTGSYDADNTGVSADEAVSIAVRLATSVAYRHHATSADGWGDQWQSALHAYYAGNAAWLLWDELGDTDRRQVVAMLENEANRFIDYTVPYYRNPDGAVQFLGDSKAEENAWNANLLQLVTAMMPRHPHSPRWMAKNLELMMSAFARPSDVESQEVVNGKPVRDWVNGSNIAEDGTVVNHGFIHPDYMATVAMNTSGPMTYSLADMAVPEASRFNADVVYRAMANVDFPSPPYRQPGGTIYVRDDEGEPSASIYYPEGNDWGSARRAHFAILDASAHLFGYDDDAGFDAAQWEHEHIQTVLDMQARGGDGRTYQGAGEDTYSGREEWVAVEIARAQLAHWLDAHGEIEWSNGAYPVTPRDEDLAELTLDAPQALQSGISHEISATLESHAELLRQVEVDLAVPSGWNIERTSQASSASLRNGESLVATWRVSAPADAEPWTQEALEARATFTSMGRSHSVEAIQRVLVELEGRISPDHMSVSATSSQPGYEAANLLDRNTDTIWHSQYRPYIPLPHSVTFKLSDSYDVTELYYQPRLDHPNGSITEYNIYASSDGADFSHVASGEWDLDTTAKKASFSAPGAKHVRLEVLQGGGNYASGAEVSLIGSPTG